MATAGLAGCVYFNALYNANQLFDRGLEEIEAGNAASGRSTLGASIEKAERVVERSPEGPWADDALRLIAHARFLREEWPEMAAAARRLMGLAEDRRDSVRAAGYVGVAAVHEGASSFADSMLTIALGGYDEHPLGRSRLLHARGIARARAGSIQAADADLREAGAIEPDWLAPPLERARLLAEVGQGDRAVEEFAHVLRFAGPALGRSLVSTARDLSELDTAVAIRALSGVDSSRLSTELRATLIELRGELLHATGHRDRAEADFRHAIELGPRSEPAAVATLYLARSRLQRLVRPDELDAVKKIMAGAITWSFPMIVGEIRRLLDATRRVQYWTDSAGLGYLAAAEAARDELGAPALARTLFLRYADSYPDSDWAPKAILAALDLPTIDSGRDGNGPADGRSPAALRERLLAEYRGSPYVRAVLGGDGSEDDDYRELETTLGHHLRRLALEANGALRSQPDAARVER